jgi:hypothetical protein
MRQLEWVYLWTQHGLNDVPTVRFKSGLRDDFEFSRPGPGRARPAWHTWRDLPGAPSP